MTRRSRWPLFVGIGGFLIFASTFLYFFVDDEGIPFVFAQNLLHHKGLTYSAFEGPVEGYSDFLHVWLATGLLAITQVLGAPKLTVFFIGKAISLVAGVLTIVWTDRLLRASPEIDGDGRAVGVMFLALAGPLAVWSCSSLEAATFGAIVTLLLYALFAPAPPWTDRLACTAAILAILERIDGFIHVAVLVGVACIIASPERRRALARRIVLPVALVLVAYHLGRRWYFGEWFSTPMLVKVLDNLHPRGVMISKTPDRNYLASFLASTGWLMPIGAPAVLIALHRRRRMMALLLATLAMCGYLALVGDWMFGFRFFVPLLPWFAVLLAAAVSALIRRWPIARPWLVAAVLIAIASNAFRFEQAYHDSDDRPNWLLHPSLDAGAYFAPMYSLYEMVRPTIAPGETMAFNQAGFVPFMLDADNIDDLGVCSRFIAHLPTTDYIHTGVGRFAPLTNKPSIRAAHAYLLYREPRVLIVRGDLIRGANDRRAPAFLLDNRYRSVAYDEAGDNHIYVRTNVPVTPFRTTPQRFVDNLLHVSSLRRAIVQGHIVPPASYLQELHYLYDGTGRIRCRDGDTIDLSFGPPDVDVYELHIDTITALAPVTIQLQLRAANGRAVFHDDIDVGPGQDAHYHIMLTDKVRAARLTLEFRTAGATDPVNVHITDLRVQGQRPELAAYVQHTLHFAAPLETRDPDGSSSATVAADGTRP